MNYTGKAGVGKRYLDENGNFLPITTLPIDKQREIQENSRKISKANNDARMRKQGLDVEEMEKAVNDDKFLSIIEKQSAVIDRLEARLNEVENAGKSVEEDVVDAPVKLTKKEKLLAEALDMGLVVDENNTIKEIEALIASESEEVEVEVIAADDPNFKDTDDEGDDL